MTAAENIAIAPRAGKAFTFLKNGSVEFFPGAGSSLHFANRDTDTFTARGLPAGLLQAGDEVTVDYNGAVVFRGDVKTIVDRHGRGDERVQDVTVAGPWDRLNRLVFRQKWGAGSLEFSSSRVILGQTAAGLAQTMAAQLEEIVGFAATPCGIALGTNGAPAQYLPLDEARDITCADAIRRELRFFPKLIVRFDYSGAAPALVIAPAPGADAGYVASIPKTERVYQYNAQPVTCVDVAVDAVDIAINGDGASFHQVWPPDGDTASLDCLHVTVPLAHGGGSTESETFKIESEEIPGALNDVAWWKSKHPRLANVAAGAIRFASSPTRSPSNYGYIVKNAKEEIEAAGKHCEVSRFECKVKIETADDVEDEIALTMDFLTTDARSGTYTVQTGSTATAGEELPEGLAKALYEQRAGALVGEQMTIRLGETFPVLGDAADGLFLQSFDVDCADLTARLSFGQPEHLSAEDMRSLLNGFRQRGSASSAVLREQAGEDDGEEPDAPGGIPPIASSEWSPGTKAKTTIKGGAGGPIELDSSKVTDGTMKVRTLTLKGEDGGTQTVQYLATSDAVISHGEREDDGDEEGEDGDDPCAHPGSNGDGGVPADNTDAHGFGPGIGSEGDGGIPADDNHGMAVGKPCNCD